MNSEDKSYAATGIAIVVVLLMITAFVIQVAANPFLDPGSFQCADCENRAKTESSVNDDYDKIYLNPWQIITAVYVKAGQGCFAPDGDCYNIIKGGVGYSYVEIERLDGGPNCQAISHIEVCYEEQSPTDTPTDTPTITNTPFQPETDTPTPAPSETESPTHTTTPTRDPTATKTPGPTQTSSGNGKG